MSIMDFHGKSENVTIDEKFPFTEENVKDLTITPNYPSLFNKFEDNKFFGHVQSSIIAPALEYRTPKDDKYADFIMSRVEYDEAKNPKFFKTRKEDMPEAEEFINEFGFKLYKYKSEDGRTKYFCDNFSLDIVEAKKKWDLGYPLVAFKEGEKEEPKTYFPDKVEDKPNLFLIILTNISNMDFERISTIEYENVKDFLSDNGIKQYHNLITLNRLLDEKPDFLNRKYNGFLIHNKQNLQSLLLNPPPRFGESVSKWKALYKMVKMIKDHDSEKKD
jgi:hypothetical protein